MTPSSSVAARTQPSCEVLPALAARRSMTGMADVISSSPLCRNRSRRPLVGHVGLFVGHTDLLGLGVDRDGPAAGNDVLRLGAGDFSAAGRARTTRSRGTSAARSPASMPRPVALLIAIARGRFEPVTAPGEHRAFQRQPGHRVHGHRPAELHHDRAAEVGDQAQVPQEQVQVGVITVAENGLGPAVSTSGSRCARTLSSSSPPMLAMTALMSGYLNAGGISSILPPGGPGQTGSGGKPPMTSGGPHRRSFSARSLP